MIQTNVNEKKNHFSPTNDFFSTGTIIFAIFIFLSSCKTQKQVQYLQGPIDTAALSTANFTEPVIQKGDLIGITVYSDNPEATSIFNQQMTTSIPQNALSATAAISSTIGSGSQSMPGYLVDSEGNIQFQKLGNLHIEGLTKQEVTKLLQSRLVQYLKNPYCNVRFLNYKITILGEVTRQGVYTIASERINVLEALGMAGDITIYSMKDSILVIREINGKRTFGNLNVTDPTTLLSPYYNLQQNDIVIVKANPKKPTLADQNSTRNLAVIATVATIITSLSVVLNIILR